MRRYSFRQLCSVLLIAVDFRVDVQRKREEGLRKEREDFTYRHVVVLFLLRANICLI